jgi:DNA invertase Pin-like site-specific DNA recombinase
MKHDHPTNGPRGVGLLRVSDPTKQDHQSQRATIQAWLDMHGLQVQLWLYDGGSRDTAFKRPEFLKLLGLVADGGVDWVVVDAQDRFGTANTWEFGKFICHLREHNCQLWSVSQGCLSSDDAFSQQFLGKPYTWRLRGAPAATHR